MLRYLILTLTLCTHSLLSATAQSHIFREYDIRGIVNQEFIPEDGYDIACAIATYFREAYPQVRTIAVGADGRIHSPQLKDCVSQGLLDMGYDVIHIGTCTTPVLYYTLATTSIEAGIMITASHNPGEYNGMKIGVGAHPICGAELRKVRDIYLKAAFASKARESGQPSQRNMISPYVDDLVSRFPHLIGKEVNALIDCGNGAAGTVLPELIEKMQWKKVACIFAEVDGSYPNHVADPTVEKYMQTLKEMLKSSTYAVGVGFDGDCDRMAPMTKAGRLVKGDQLATLYSRPMLANYPGATIIFDISSSQALLNTVQTWGGKAVLAPTGAVNIRKKMQALNAILAGEMSCHTMFNDRYFGFDDGMYSMLRLFELLDSSKCTLDDLLSELPEPVVSPLYRLPCERELCFEIIEDLKMAFQNNPDVDLIQIDGLRVEFPQGFGIVRPSNTEPLLSMRFEGRTFEDLQKIQRQFYKVIGNRIDLPQERSL